jgi:putative addiction module component (TIGR02574 family)
MVLTNVFTSPCVARIAATGRPCDDQVMPLSPLTELLKLPAGDRAELAMALWESLSDAERDGELELTEADRAELDRRWAEHLENPGSAVPWSEVRSKLIG